MKIQRTIILLCSLLLTSCSNEKTESNNTNTAQASASPVNVAANASATSMAPFKQLSPGENPETGFKPNFIKADNLLKMVQNKEKVHIFDVRDLKSYNEAHISGALNKPIPVNAAMVKEFAKDTPIITYCGCPHHLSSIAAEQLTNLGYKDVKVLDEGFWYWKDHKFPLDTSATTKAQVSEISVAGILNKASKPYNNVDIYLKHVKSGQLEATKTDANGAYKMHFHLYNYQNKDQFKFYVADLRNEVQDFSTDKQETNNVIVNMK